MPAPPLSTLARRACALASFWGLLSLPATPRAADPQLYAVTIAPTGNAALDKALHDSSSLISLQKTAPVGPFALVTRAQGDAGRFLTALHSFGYYGGSVAIQVAGKPVDDTTLAQTLDQTPASTTVPVTATMTLGPLFHLRKVVIDGAVPADVEQKLAPVGPGAPAVAADVLAAQARLQSALLDDGYALAKVDTPIVTEDAAAQVLDVSYHVVSGPRVDLGPIALQGLGQVNESYVRRRLMVHQGEQYNPDKIDAARQDLVATGVFSSVRVDLAEKPDAAGQLPLTFIATERPRHAVAFTAAYSTDLGGSAGVTWTHRNLFGNAEQLNLSAEATQLGGSESKTPGYEIGAQLIKPDFLRRDQQIQFDLNAFKEDLDAYSRQGYSGDVVLTRKLSTHWSVSGGLKAVQESVEQEDVKRDYTLLSIPIGLKYDSTDSLFLPTQGVRGAATITPTQSLGGSTATFVLLQAQASTYIDMKFLGTAPGRSIIAVRGLVGSAQGATQFQLPPDQRFYAGGSATIRGFKYQSVGPQFADENPQGGTSIDTGTVEFRQRIGASFGVVGFVDAGQVGTSSAPFTGQTRIGAGGGARYYTSIGPIRLDVAVPLNKERGGDAFELYIGLGEAF